MGSERAKVVLVVEVADDAVWIDVAHLDACGWSEPELCSCQILERVEMLWERVIVHALEAALCGAGEEDDGGRGGMCGPRRVGLRAEAEGREGVGMLTGSEAVDRRGW